MLNICKLHI